MAKKIKPKLDAEREERIDMEIVADCYDSHERLLGWIGYLEDRLQFPFTATCIAKRASSPLSVNDEVEVLDFCSDESKGEMYVMMRWERRGLAVPLAQLKPQNDTGEATQQAVADWHYWVAMGYTF